MRQSHERRFLQLKRKLKCNKVILPLLLCLILAGTLTTGITHAQKAIKRWVSGTVVATDTRAVPNTIVVKSHNWKGEELIVGAQVHRRTRITIDGKPASLSDVATGDKVSMVYTREPTRLVARIIEVKRGGK